MDTIKAIKERRSIRKFKNEKVDKNILEKIIEASRYSPTWGHSQLIRYNVIEDTKMIKNISDTAMLGFGHNMNIMSGTPCVLILSHQTDRSGVFPGIQKKPAEWQMFDAGSAAQTFALAAHDQGIGSVVLGAFDQDVIAEIINLPKNECVSAVIALGYEIECPKVPPRKEVNEILRFI